MKVKKKNLETEFEGSSHTPSVCYGRHIDYSAGGGALEFWKKQVGQQKVTQMIDS